MVGLNAVWPPVAEPPAPLSAQERERVADEQLRMVVSHTRVGAVIAGAFAVMVALYLHGSVAIGLVQLWLASKLALAVGRLAFAHWHARLQHPGGPTWHRATYLLLGLDGSLWGLAGFVLMAEPVQLSSLAAASLACVSCVATFGLQVRVVATAAYVVPILAPTALGLLLRGDEFGLVGGSCMPLLLVVQLLTARSNEHRFAASVLSRLQAQALAQEKAAALLLAQRQSEVKTQFLANISHELRTPLHGVLGLARLLHLEARDRGVAHRLELIEASATHLLGLINDLLDVSRIETGRFSIRRERFELGTQTGVVAGVVSVRARDKGVSFKMHNAFDRPHWVIGDAARYRQVLHNLLGNAIKFTQQGSIELRLMPGGAPDLVRVEVVDTGPGIAASELMNIFEAFYQASSDANRLASGAGLGLTIARELAQAMGGDIVASSEVGRGSVFVFTARLAEAAQPGAEEMDGDVLASPSPINLRTVLVAEDDDVNALIIGAYLEQLGLVCERVGNGKDAVTRALRPVDRPDLVLMDCRMPLMDGLTATREIRTQEHALELHRVPVIALTAASSYEDRQSCVAAGMDDFIAKPFTKEELSRVLSQWGGAGMAGTAYAVGAAGAR